MAVVLDLLFADTYGYRLVRPEMVEVSAWLAGENDAIADSLIARSPYNLLRYGDPGSLPIPVRVKAFAAALAQVETIDPQKLWFGEQGLRRFADPGLDDHIAGWWEIAKGDEEARHLLLRLVDFGGQKGGLPVVRQVAYDRSTDEITQLLAGRALLKLGEKADRTAYARHVTEHGSDLSRSIILQALDALFPEEIDVGAFFALIDKAGVTGEDDIATILPLGSELPAGLTRREDLHRFLTEVVARSGDFSGDTVDDEKPFREAFSQMAASAALRLLDYHPADIPDVVTDLFLLLHESHRRIGSEASFKTLGEAFGASPWRRRTSLWRSIVRLRTHPYARDDGELNIWFVQHLGWPVLLSLADIDWLLLDVRERTDRQDRLTALRAAHTLWRQFGGTDGDMQRIVDAVADDAELSAQLAAWRSPPPETPEMVERMREEWDSWFKDAPPSLAPELMRHAIAHAMQEKALGKLPARIARQIAASDTAAPSSAVLGPGDRFDMTAIPMIAGTMSRSNAMGNSCKIQFIVMAPYAGWRVRPVLKCSLEIRPVRPGPTRTDLLHPAGVSQLRRKLSPPSSAQNRAGSEGESTHPSNL